MKAWLYVYNASRKSLTVYPTEAEQYAINEYIVRTPGDVVRWRFAHPGEITRRMAAYYLLLEARDDELAMQKLTVERMKDVRSRLEALARQLKATADEAKMLHDGDIPVKEACV